MVATVRLLSVTFSGALTRSLSSRDVLLGDSDTTPSSRPRGSSFGVDVELGWVPDRSVPLRLRARPMATGTTVSGMLTTSQVTPAQRRIRESIRTRPPDLQLRAQHHHL